MHVLYRQPLTASYLNDRFLDKGWSYFQIYKETGWSKATINTKLREYQIRRKKNLRALDLSGQRFSHLTVVRRGPNKGHCRSWICKCVCGNEVVVLTGNLLSGNSRSCGCISKTRVGSNHPTWRGKGCVPRRFWSILLNNAEKRGICVNVAFDEVAELYEKQERKCALTGWLITFSSSGGQTASLDRIDSSKGYELGNIQWIHKDVNRAKNVLSQCDFLQLCSAVSSYRHGTGVS